jgi:hypothetical protein
LGTACGRAGLFYESRVRGRRIRHGQIQEHGEYLSKNFVVFAVSSLGFLLLGWGLMFGGDNRLSERKTC